MTRLKLSIFLCALCAVFDTTAQMYDWAQTFGGNSSDFAQASSVDAANNIISVGWFSGTADFDPQSGTTNITAEGGDDIFVQKLDANGNLLWVRSIGGIGDDYGTDIVTDATGNIYVTGHFSETVDFDPGAGSTTLTSQGYSDNFILKLSPQGDLLWVRQTGGSYFEYSFSIAIDGSNNLYTTGDFEGNVDFDPGTAVLNLSSNGGSDVYIQKFDETGSLLWARTFGGSGYDRGYSLEVDAMGNVHTAGTFQYTVDFDPNSGVNDLTSANLSDFFIQKLSPSGDFLWVRALNSVEDEYFSPHIAIDYAGNIYTGGGFSGTTDFDPGPGNMEISPAGDEDAFILKLNNGGDFQWVRNLNGTYSASCWAIYADSSGNVYTTGNFYDTIDIDPGPGTRLLTANGGTDVFIHQLDTDGNLVFGKSFGGSSFEAGNSIVVDSSQNIYTAGYFSNTVDFDPASAEDVHSSTGGYDAFIQKLIPCTSYTTGTDVQTAIDSLTWIDGNTYYSDNNTATYTLENSMGCDSIVTLDLTILSSGLSVHQKESSILVYPNPAKDRIHIEFNSVNVEAVTIRNAQGKKLRSVQVKEGATELDLSAYSKGLYFVNVHSSDGLIIKRFLKD